MKASKGRAHSVKEDAQKRKISRGDDSSDGGACCEILTPYSKNKHAYLCEQKPREY